MTKVSTQYVFSVLGGFIALFFMVSSALATNWIEVYPYVSDDGYISFTCPKSGNVLGSVHWQATYPTENTQKAIIVAGEDCENISHQDYTMEGGWRNETPATTDDGDHWVKFTYEGTVGYPEYSDDVYFFRTVRSADGIWQPAYLVLPPNASTTDPDFGILGNYFRDVFVYLFKPAQNSVSQFANLKIEMETKAPFAYFVSVKNALSGISTSTTPVFQLATSTAITNTIFNPLKIGFTWLLWIIFGFWVIRKISGFIF